jgi:hypothetical protein
MEIPRFYQREKKGIGGLTGMSLAMIQKSLPYTPINKSLNQRYRVIDDRVQNRYPIRPLQCAKSQYSTIKQQL